jgi:hypothetical protein
MFQQDKINLKGPEFTKNLHTLKKITKNSFQTNKSFNFKIQFKCFKTALIFQFFNNFRNVS